jgi:cytochrome c556
VLAQRTGKQDYAGSKRAMEALATSCNHCHQTFRVPTRIHAWAPPTKVGG